MTSDLDAWFEESRDWQEPLARLRAILRKTPLDETLKWNMPCYLLDGSTLAGLGRLKDKCWLMFHKGALLRDPEGLLQRPGDHSQSMRVVPFTTVDAVAVHEAAILALVDEAIAAARAGLKVAFKETGDFDFPDEFVDMLDTQSDLREAFDALTPGRQRGYLIHFGQAKQSATRRSRIEKSIPRILAGQGMHDR